MRLAAVLLLLTTGAWGQPVRVAAPAARFPSDFVRSVQLSLAKEPFYGSQLLNGLGRHLQQVVPMPKAESVKLYLEAEVAATPRAAQALKSSLGRESLEAERAAALLLANGLARPDQFRDVLEGLEAAKPGLGFKVTELLKEAGERGRGHPEFMRLLRAVGERSAPVGKPFIYDARGRLSRLFDGTREEPAGGAMVPAGPVSAEGYRQDGQPRSSGLLPAPKKKGP
jgi:hypothetical protein